MIEPADLMQIAIETCREGLSKGQSPFGCAIALDGELIAASHNSVVLTTDITAHAEVNAIRAACQAREEIFLPEAVVATTCEPCPMCMSALHWARVGKVYYGASIADAENAGFNELSISAEEILRVGSSSVELHGGLLAEECRSLFAQWQENPDRRSY